jgi:NAD(P)-dependent dehydrogenase (short-subunit alcohol dehydrogenase family)
MNIKDSVVLVTGANRGLGLAFTQELLARGAKKVYAGARDPESVAISGVVPVKIDVTKPETIEQAAKQLGDVTFLINNAGVSRGQGALAANAIDKARDEMETNYLGPLAVSAAFAPVLAKNGGGAILNILSVLSWVASARSTTYSASKAAAWALTNGIRQELAAQKTQVVGLHVGFVDTDLVRHLPVPKVAPAEVARIGLDAVESGITEVLVDELSRGVKSGLSAGVYLGSISA